MNGSQESVTATASGFFSYPLESPLDVVERLLSERQIGYVASDWSLGKTPLLQQLALCVSVGIPFLSLQSKKRPVIILDAETTYEDYRPSIERTARRLGIADFGNLHIFLRYGHPSDRDSATFRQVIGSSTKSGKFIRSLLEVYPDALIILDPLMEIMPYDEKNPYSALTVVHQLRELLGDFPHAAILFVLHLRKSAAGAQDGVFTAGPTSWYTLLNNPRAWFQEVAGTNKIGAHTDVRLGMAATCHDEHQLILNGFKRGKEAAFLCFERSQDQTGEYDGYLPSRLPENAPLKLKPEQEHELARLPRRFRFVDVADNKQGGMPHTSLSRLLNAAAKAGRAYKDAEDYWNIPEASASGSVGSKA